MAGCCQWQSSLVVRIKAGGWPLRITIGNKACFLTTVVFAISKIKNTGRKNS